MCIVTCVTCGTRARDILQVFCFGHTNTDWVPALVQQKHLNITQKLGLVMNKTFSPLINLFLLTCVNATDNYKLGS